MSELLIDEIPSALGTIVLIARAGRLVALEYGDRRERLTAALAARHDAARLHPAADPFGISGCLRAYLAGELAAIDRIVVDTGGTPLQRLVWDALRRIPAGTTLTYAEMAGRIGRPRALRAVGAINARNPVSIVVPCHRLIGSDGSLTGYGGGLWRKRWLLDHEAGAVAAATSGRAALATH